MTFGTYVRRARKAQGIGVREMALKIGVSHVYLSRVEKGKPPSDEIIVSLAAELDEDTDLLFALAGRLRDETVEMVSRKPKKFKELLRKLRRAPEENSNVRDGNW